VIVAKVGNRSLVQELIGPEQANREVFRTILINIDELLGTNVFLLPQALVKGGLLTRLKALKTDGIGKGTISEYWLRIIGIQLPDVAVYRLPANGPQAS
jgi:hypothetical protein